MVLSNTKLKRKKKEEAALAPPPDSNATLSSADVVMNDSPAVASAKKKKRPKAKKSLGVDGNGSVGDVPADGDNGAANVTPDVAVEGGALKEEGVKQSKKKRKNAPEVAVVQETPLEPGEKLPSSAGGDAGVSEVNGGGSAASEANLGQGEGEEVPKTKLRKKPRWEVDENGKRIKPKKVEGEGEGPSDDPKASTSSEKGTEEGADITGAAEKNGDAASAPDSDRIHQGDEPWLQSKRSKKKKKLLDKWGKKVDEAAAVADKQVVDEEAPQNVSRHEIALLLPMLSDFLRDCSRC